MEFITMHSKSKVTVCPEWDSAGQLSYSFISNICEQYWEIAEFTREEVDYMIYTIFIS